MEVVLPTQLRMQMKNIANKQTKNKWINERRKEGPFSCIDCCFLSLPRLTSIILYFSLKLVVHFQRKQKGSIFTFSCHGCTTWVGGWKQCDQIWRIFTTLAKVYKFLTFYFLFGKMLSLLWQICDIIGYFSLLQMAKYLKIIFPSGHTGWKE